MKTVRLVPILATLVALFASTAPAKAAIYGTQDFYDDDQRLTFLANCGQADVDYITIPRGAYKIVLSYPGLGDPILETGTSEGTQHITNIVREGDRFAVYGQADPGTCAGEGIVDSRIEYRQRVRLDGHCTEGEENLAAHGGFIGNIVATNVRCDVARRYVQRFRFHGAGVGATFRQRGYRCHVGGLPQAATIRCTASHRRAIRWNVGD